MKLSLKVKLIAGVAAGVSLITGLGVTSYLIASTLGHELHKVQTIADVLRNHTVGDMLHDGLRADVYAAFYAAASQPGKKETIISETREHAAQFREILQKNKSANLPADAKAALAGVEGPLQAYIQSAETIVAKAFADPTAAAALLEDFDRRFSELESAMDAAGDGIQATATQQSQEARTYEQIAIWVSLIAGMLGLSRFV